MRQAEREALLQTIIDLVNADQRVVAAWLFGSFGRGTADEWSDLDLHLVIADEHAEALKAARREYVARVAAPLLIQEMPQNAPPRGAYLLVMYPGEAGPHMVDWYWQPQSAALIPPDSRLILDRVGIPPAPLLAPLTAQQHIEAVEQDVIFFWMMINVIAKKIIRKQPWVVLNLMDMIHRTLEAVRWHVGARADHPDYRETAQHANLPPVYPLEQLALLRHMANDMKALMPKATALGAALPLAVVPPTYTFLDTVEALLSTES